MSNQSKKLLWRIKQKAKRLKRALIRELEEDVEMEQCMEWVCTAYGFRSPDDVGALYQPEGFAFDESITKTGLYHRLNFQTRSLAFDFDLEEALARNLIVEVRPTALCLSRGSDDQDPFPVRRRSRSEA